jgi:hypothetical protein
LDDPPPFEEEMAREQDIQDKFSTLIGAVVRLMNEVDASYKWRREYPIWTEINTVIPDYLVGNLPSRGESEFSSHLMVLDKTLTALNELLKTVDVSGAWTHVDWIGKHERWGPKSRKEREFVGINDWDSVVIKVSFLFPLCAQ